MYSFLPNVSIFMSKVLKQCVAYHIENKGLMAETVFSELTKQRWQRFRKIRRAWFSLWVLGAAYVLSLFSPWLVNDAPLLMSYKGELYFPAWNFYTEQDFGGKYKTEMNYERFLRSEHWLKSEGWVINPPVPHDPLHAYLNSSGSPPHPPSTEHWLGTDANGRDVLSRLIHGFRIGMSFSLFVTLIGTILGVIIGGVQGYAGGKIDLFFQRFIEIWSALPFLYVVILIGSLFGRSFALLLVVMSLFQWIGLSYYMRGEFFRLRKMEFVQAARSLGMSRTHIFFKEILPNALNPVITIMPFSLIGGIGALTSLDFLGFGMPPPTPSWGELLSQGLDHLYAPWIAISTTLALFLTLLMATFIGEGVRAALDPKSGDRYE
jgi:microcin C transport system permease protein